MSKIKNFRTFFIFLARICGKIKQPSHHNPESVINKAYTDVRTIPCSFGRNSRKEIIGIFSWQCYRISLVKYVICNIVHVTILEAGPVEQ